MEKISKIILYSFALIVLPQIACAGFLTFIPSQKSPKAGSTFTVTVAASTADRAMNAASGVVTFDAEKLEAVGVSKTGSIISLWAEEPTRSNALGTISFEGIAFSPGYIGDNGKLFTITFRARREGETKLSFASGSILANDGTGGNILSSLQPLALVVAPDAEVVKEIPKKVEQKTDEPKKSLGVVNSTIVIKSHSHPEDEKWYSDNTPEFSWSLPDETLEVKTLINKSPTRTPTISYIPPITEKTSDSLADGTYYFTVQARTPSGWTNVARKAVKIDTVPPRAFTVNIANETRDRHMPPALVFSTVDAVSEIAHYEVRVGEGEVLKTTAHESDNPFLLPPQNPGAHVVTVSAFDEAGNVRTETAGFIIEAIDTPKLISYPSVVTSGDAAEIKGVTYPNGTLTFYYRDGDKVVLEETVRANEQGAFTMPITRKLASGAYILSARVTDVNGARSNETAPIIISFKPLYATVAFIAYLLIAITVLLAVGVALWMWKRSQRIALKTALIAKHLARDAQQMTERSFEVLHDDVTDRLAELRAIRPKRKFIDDEIRFLEETKESLGEAKGLIVDDIRKISDGETPTIRNIFPIIGNKLN